MVYRLIGLLGLLTDLLFLSPPSAAAANPEEEPVPCEGGPSFFLGRHTNLPHPLPDDCPLPGSLALEDLSQLRLPDLRTLPPFDLKIVILPDGLRELRLSNTVWNSGSGPLELQGSLNPATHRTRVEQHVATPSGDRLSRLVGEFIWHQTHDHWHFEQFSLYELWMLSPDGQLDRLVSSSEKVSYCVIDTSTIAREMEGYPSTRQYTGCDQDLQGLSVGWGDTYRSHLDGQSIHLPLIQDGFYALKSTANPNAILLEADYRNNIGLVYLDIRGDRIRLLDLSAHFERLCQESAGRGLPDIACRD